MDPITAAIQHVRAHLRRRNYSAYTLDSYTLDLRLFFADGDKALDRVTFTDVDRCIDGQYHQGLTPATINRRLYALKHFFDFLIERQVTRGNPVKPSHA